MPERQVIVDPATGNVLVIHKRSVGCGTILFFAGLIFVITAKYAKDDYDEVLYSLGCVCFSLLVLLLLWRCCCCCCRTQQSPGYVVVPPPNNNPQPGYPVAPSVHPVLTTYPNPGSGPGFSATPFAVSGASPQPPFNPNAPLDNATAPPLDAPPSYTEATAIPFKH